MNKRTVCCAVSAALASTLFLGGCGGGEGTAKEIEGADSAEKGAKTSDPSKEASPEADAPNFPFPQDLKVTIDADTTGDKVKDTILRDNGYAVKSILLGFAKQDPGLAVLGDYLGEKALLGFSGGIESFKADGKTISGSVRYYDRVVKLGGQGAATVRYCEDQRYLYDKDAKTDKVNKTKPSAKSFVLHTAVVKKDDDGTWKMVLEESEKGAAQCRL
ncbi:hypothetical protein [Streptomyces sp. NPDC047108]|uniref:hypothetical protein n=1 Tax=Streptomyces sp. NPDC047108 TaxID=3155025 RepID=UPI0033EC958A